MPPKSQAQRRWAYAAAEGKIPGVARSVGVEFEGHGVKGLPEKVQPFAKKRSDARPSTRGPRTKRKDSGQNGEGAAAPHNAGGYGGGGGPKSQNEYSSSYP
jgi:hypothetical protein